MARRRKNVWTKIAALPKTHTSEIVALCSLLVALLSLVYSVEAQRDERRHKMLALRPHLQLQVSDLKVQVRNLGPGTALVRDFFMIHDVTCFRTAGIRFDSLEAQKLLAEKVHEILETFAADPPNNHVAPQLRLEVNVLQLGELITAGEVRDLIAFPEGFKEVALPLLKNPQWDEFKRDMTIALWKLPLGIRFCSIIGQDCTDTGNDEIIKSCRLTPRPVVWER